jgi:trans-L-3-hydroxyproline dehydratase
MDIIGALDFLGQEPIVCVEMHTTGEPTRIVIKGYPNLSGTLLEQREEAKNLHDHIRIRLMLEPAGHADMYGAILRPETELTKTGEAHMGVLFTHNEGYSTMCGHATIALGRLLVDTHDQVVFPRRSNIKVDTNTSSAEVRLHAPCGLVIVTVPVTADGQRSDPGRPVSFISVPSFSTAADIQIEVPPLFQWPELHGRNHIRVSFCYGGAFTCLVHVEELGFGRHGLSKPINHEGLDAATKKLKSLINTNPAYHKYMQHYEHTELSSLYTLMVMQKGLGNAAPETSGAETGLCFFADQQIDRSPTGSAVAARVAHAYATGTLKIGESWTYHSLVSNNAGGRGGFIGTAVEEIPDLYNSEAMLAPPIGVKVEGYAYYVGSHVFIAEKEDPIGGGGFLFDRIGR